ncbi:MAG: LytTR family DNA-binding domain-containing protein [Flavobacteriaceae bacterium]|nr:LytTR family DNA-binding domain-containing protein [Flavobacteriaceae bacterium]
MIKVIIIEDEINVRAGLKKMLKILEPTLKIVAETGFVNQAIQQIKKEKPDLIFLDIKLEDGTGFDILKQLKNIDFKIIFTTAYNEYAVNAFKFSAVDYLLKPIDPIELQGAIKRALFNIGNEKEHQDLLAVLKNNLVTKVQKIVLKTTKQHYIIYVKDIINLKADGAYTHFITTNKKITVSKNLKYYQDLLSTTFIRCHQSHLVNSKHIMGLNKECLQMSNHSLIPISTRKKAEIIKLIHKI